MPKFEKSSPELVSQFQDTMLDFPQVTLRKTFGCPCAYVNGHMATGLFADSIFLRLGAADEIEFLKIPGAASFAPMQNRPMRGYVVVPEDMQASKDQLISWIARSLEHVSGLPPKEKKPQRKRP